MKTNLYSKMIFSAIAIMFCGSDLLAQWTNINTGIPGSIEEIEAPSADTVFLKTTRLYRTFNGGDTFDTLSFPGVNNVTHISFVNNRAGFVAVRNDNTSENEMFFTSNAGGDWLRVTPPHNTDLVENIAFADESRGIVMLQPRFNHTDGYYHHTSDGGQTWDYVGPLSGYYLKEAAFSGSGGFAIAHTFDVNTPDMIMKSIDGGATWEPVYHPADSINPLEGIQALSENNAIAYMNDVQNSRAVIYYTNNAGISWNRKSFDGLIMSMSFASPVNGLLINDNGMVFRTTNGGTSWEEDRGADDNLITVRAIGEVAYAGGSNGTLIKRSAIDNVQDIKDQVDGGSAYPNPSDGSVLIPTDLFGTLLSVEVKDIAGKLVGQKQIQGYHDVIQLNDLPRGVLFISITDEYNQYKVFRVIVE